MVCQCLSHSLSLFPKKAREDTLPTLLFYFSLLFSNDFYILLTREFVIVENKRLICLLDFTADFGDKTNAKLTPDCQLREKSKTVYSELSVYLSVNLTPIFFCKFPDVYSLIYNFSANC